MTVYDVSAAQLFECWHGAHRLAQYREQQRVYAVGRRGSNGLGKVIGVGTVAPSLRVRGRGNFSRVTLLLRHGNFLPSYWKLHTAAEKRRKKRWPCSVRRSPKQPVISVEVRTSLHVRALDVIDYVFYM